MLHALTLHDSMDMVNVESDPFLDLFRQGDLDALYLKQFKNRR